MVKELLKLSNLDGDGGAVLEGVDVDGELRIGHDVLVDDERDNLLCVIHHRKGRGRALHNAEVLLQELLGREAEDVLVAQPELVLELLEVDGARRKAADEVELPCLLAAEEEVLDAAALAGEVLGVLLHSDDGGVLKVLVLGSSGVLKSLLKLWIHDDGNDDDDAGEVL